MTLRLRLGTVIVKKEPEPEDDWQAVAELDYEGSDDSSMVTLRCQLGVDIRLKLEDQEISREEREGRMRRED